MNEMTASSQPEVKPTGGNNSTGTSSTATGEDSYNNMTGELLSEATQLLKSLRLIPKLQAMKIARVTAEEAQNGCSLIQERPMDFVKQLRGKNGRTPMRLL